jgi:hypothetical protein
VAHEIPSGYQNPAFVVALGAASRSLFGSVVCVYGRDPFGLWRSCFSFFSIFSLIPWKFMHGHLKNNCVLQFVILSILTLFLYIIVYFILEHFIDFSIFLRVFLKLRVYLIRITKINSFE